MKVLRNRALSLFLAFVMTMSMIPGAVFAAETGLSQPESETTIIPDDRGVDTLAGQVTYYVANSAAGGSDDTGDGTQTKPYLTIGKVLAVAAGSIVSIELLSDIESTQGFVFDKQVSISGGGHRLAFTGTSPIGNNSGFIQANDSLTLTNLTVANATDAIDARLVYLRGDLMAAGVTFSDGKMMTANGNEGGAAVFGASGVDVSFIGCEFIGNKTNGGGGAIYVSGRSHVFFDGDTSVGDNTFSNNEATNGGGIYVGTGAMIMFPSGSTSIKSNKATVNGGGMYLEAGVAVSGQGGTLTVSDNTAGGKSNNAWLSENASFDSMSPSSAIHVSAAVEQPYTLISETKLTSDADIKAAEESFYLDSGAYDVRYMEYKGAPGLYLYPKTLDVSFVDTSTLTSVSGLNLNGEIIDYMQEPYQVAYTSLESNTNTLNIKGLVPAIEQDYEITFTCDTDLYRIPTEDVVTVKDNKGNAIDFVYTPDVEAGTGTITIAGATIAALGAGVTGIEFNISAEKYHDLTLRMDGPLYTMTSSITGLSEKIAVLSESNKTGDTAVYQVTRNDVGLAGVTVELHKADDNSLVGNQVTAADGRVSFTGLQTDANYYTVLKYEDLYRVIERDVIELQLSTLEGQTLDANVTATDGTVNYDSSTGVASITGVKQDSTVTFSVEQAADMITFDGNAGDATTGPAVLSVDSKEMAANANTYGELAVATLTGYTFAGWFTEADGGTEITAATAYQTGVSPRVLYAHWTANTDTEYTIQHWVEFSPGGANPGYIDGVTETKDNGAYYLYDAVTYDDGVSDVDKDIRGLWLTSMSDNTLTWWTLDGFSTANLELEHKVLANGSSKFDMCYDRKSYEISFQNNGMGTATNPEKIDSLTVEFGAVIGKLPVTTLPGYEFGGWHVLGQTALVTATDIFTQTENMTLEAGWNTSKTAQWAIKIAIQDVTVYPDGEAYLPGTYTKYQTVYLDNDGNALTGETDEALVFAIDSINALAIKGFDYVGYSANYAVNGDNRTADTANASIFVKPTTMLTATPDGKYNEAFDGGIVWLYYDRKISDITVEDGQGNVHEDEVIFGGTLAGHLPADPSKDGYDFANWVDVDDNIVDSKTSVDDYVLSGGMIEIKPSWTARQYNLTYRPGTNGKFVASAGTNESDIKIVAGGGYIDPNKVTYDQALGVMPTASKNGYDFVAWMANGKIMNADTVLDVSNLVISNADKTPAYGYEGTKVMTAAYKAHEYTLVLKPGQSSVTGTTGTVSPSEVKVTFDSVITGLPTPKLTGYKFVGWQLKVDDQTSVVKNGDVWTKAHTNGAKINLYALWIPETYRYTFDLNDSVGSTRGSLVDTSIGYVEETFDSVYNGVFDVEAIRNGYEFTGWALDKNSKPLTGDDLNLIAGNTTLYAVWKPLAYDVRLVMNGATIADLTDNELDSFDPTAVYDKATDTWTIKVVFDTVYGELPIASREDATYHGYMADAIGWPVVSGSIHEQVITNLPQYIDFVDDKGITLTVVMEPWFTFESGGGKFADETTEDKKLIQSDITTLPVLTKSGYVFDGWLLDDKLVTIDDVKAMTIPVVLKPQFSAQVTFDANGGKVNGKDVDVITANTLVTLPRASKSGFDFTGWFTEATNGEPVSLTPIKETDEPVTVYAHWTKSVPTPPSGGGGGGGGGGGPVAPKEFTVSFETNGGSFVGSQILTSGSMIIRPVDPKRAFYAFDGWFTDKDLKKSFKLQTVIKADTVLYAGWTYVGPNGYLTTEHIAYIAGFGDDTVKPTANITRAEVAMMFYRLLNEDTRVANKTTLSDFTDISKNAWYRTAVATLAKMDILNGRGGNKFDPGANITRAEFAAIVSRFDELSTEKRQFSDVPSTHWAYDAISSAAAKGWVVGYGDGNFGPDDLISRAEAVTLVNRMLGRDKLTVAGMLKNMMVDDIKTWSDNSDMNSWYYLAIQEAGNGHMHSMSDKQEVWQSLTDKTPGNR